MREIDRSLPLALLHAREASLRPFRKELDKIGLTVQQWRVIRVLAEGEGRSASELSQLCVLMPPSLSRILKNLTERGLIERAATTDARKHQSRITPAGLEKYSEMAGQADEIYATLESNFGTDKMELLLDLLSELREAARER